MNGCTDRPVHLVEFGLIQDMSEHGDEKGEGLATAGLRDPDHVATAHHARDRLRLDRRRRQVVVSEITQHSLV